MGGLGAVGYIESFVYMRRSNNNHKTQVSWQTWNMYIFFFVVLDITGIGSVGLLILLCYFLLYTRELSVDWVHLRVGLGRVGMDRAIFTLRWVGLDCVKWTYWDMWRKTWTKQVSYLLTSSSLQSRIYTVQTVRSFVIDVLQVTTQGVYRPESPQARDVTKFVKLFKVLA